LTQRDPLEKVEEFKTQKTPAKYLTDSVGSDGNQIPSDPLLPTNQSAI